MAANDSYNDPPWCDRLYPTSHRLGLPRDIRSVVDDVTLVVDYARESEVTSSLRRMLVAASERGDNVGTDEFVGSRADIIIGLSEIFAVRRGGDVADEIVAFIMIGPSMYAGTMDNCLADIRVFRSRDDVVSDTSYVSLVHEACELARLLDVGYTDCILSVATSCGRLVDLSQQSAGGGATTSDNDVGFRRVAVLPHSVNINGVGLTDSITLIKNIARGNRQPRTRGQVLSALAKHGLSDNGAEGDREFYENAVLSTAPFLPVQLLLPTSGLLVNVRPIHKDEDRLAYGLLEATVERGEGMPLYCYPSLTAFRQIVLLDGLCVAFEDSRSGSFVGWYHISDSWIYRGQSARYCQGTSILAKEYQSRGIMSDISVLIVSIMRELGYRGVVGDHYANNFRSERLSRDMDSAGIIPRAGFLVGAGWQDGKFSVMEISDDGMLISEFKSQSWRQAIDSETSAKL